MSLLGILRATMCSSLSFLQSAFASSQQLPLLPKFGSAKPTLLSFPIIEAKARTRREDRTARHARIRKKVFAFHFSFLLDLTSPPFFSILFSYNTIAFHLFAKVFLTPSVRLRTGSFQILYSHAFHILCMFTPNNVPCALEFCIVPNMKIPPKF